LDLQDSDCFFILYILPILLSGQLGSLYLLCALVVNSFLSKSSVFFGTFSGGIVMSRRSENSRSVWDSLLIMAVAALAVTFGHAQQALADQDAEGRVVEISPNDGGVDLEHQAAEAEEPAVPAYWLGIEGGPLDSPILRTHLQLADDVGVVIRQVVPGSPAEKAGLKQHDILIAVGGEQITDMGTLQQAVADSNAKPLDLKVLRLAKEMTISVTPEDRPKDLVANFNRQSDPRQRFNFNFQDLPMGDVGDLLKQLQGAGIDGKLGGGVRVFGPGMILNHAEAAALPNGVSVNVTRQGDGPAKVTVKKGDQTWTIEGNDEEALGKLPEDVRPFVQQMLLGSAFGPGALKQHFRVGADAANPFADFDFAVPGPQGGRVGERILDRLEQLEKQFDRLQQKFEGENSPEGTNNADDPSKT